MKMERDTERRVLREAKVVLATLTGTGEQQLDKLGAFDLVVVDEAGQATEPASWIALLRGRRVVLAGDSQQLAPTVISRQA
jgi:superfamily I DNA and/or RNA helicase